MELTFFTAAHTVQFGFVAKRMLTTHRCFGFGWTALAQYQGFTYFPYSVPPVSALRVGEKLGGSMAGTAGPDSPKRYSVTCNIVLGNKNWGRGRSILFDGFGFFGGFFLGSQGSYLEEGWTSVSLWEVVRDFLCFAFFVPLMKLFLSWPTSFLDFVLSHLADGDEEWTIGCVGAWLLAGVDSPQKYREQMVFSEVSK